jgi:hypothetical protein
MNDTLRWTAGIPKDETLLSTNFGWSHQDVAFQWFVPAAYGIVKEFWWRNYDLRGAINTGTVRAWNANSRLLTLPNVADSKANMGWYVKSDDGDGLVTPFQVEATDTVFKPGKGIDTAKLAFDPLGREATWLPGGRQFALDSNKWQGFKLLDFGDSMRFKSDEPFGFTLQNDTKVTDPSPDTRMEIYSSTGAYPYHSIKFYELPRSSGDPGWHIRGYEWGMYVVVEYIEAPQTRITFFDKLETTFNTGPRLLRFFVSQDRSPFGGSIFLSYKIGGAPRYDTTQAVLDSVVGTRTYGHFTIPGAPPDSTVSWYVSVTDIYGDRTNTPVRSYRIFQKKYKYLFLWNGRATWASLGTMGKYYMMKDSITETVYYDAWDVKNYGKAEVPTLMDMYDVVFELNGDGGNSGADFIGTLAGPWLAKGTAANPKIYFFSDQDHGWISNYKDTTFLDADAHAQYFGVKALINQDYPNGATKTWKLDLDPNVATDPVFSFIDKKNKKDTVTLWYHPTFELSPSITNWMDELTPTATAKALFRDVSHANKVVGLRNSDASAKWHTFYLAFDHMGTDFRSDTSIAKYTTPDKDPKYAWITDVGGVVGNVLKSLTSVRREGDVIPGVYSLDQNYPNPFNPTTHLRFTVPEGHQPSAEIGEGRFVRLKIYDVLGREVETLVNETIKPGTYSVEWNASRFASGVYFYQLRAHQKDGGQAGNFVSVKKMMVVK